MKKFFTLLLSVLIGQQLFSQAPPQGVNYQAVARDVSGNPLATQTITATFRIRQTIPTGTAVYRGTLNATTNQFGLFNAIIGQTTSDSGTFSTINWSADNFYLQVLINNNNMGTTQFMSVPYSFYSTQSGTAIASGIPAGTIVAFGGTVAPTGWLLCDGTQISRTVYANLFTAISTAYGYGNNSTTFHLPDLRGRFLRGVDGSATNDPDKVSRTAINVGGNTGNNIGSLQADQLASHSHSTATNGGGSCPCTFGGAGGSFFANFSTGTAGGNETRPKNVYVNYIIKY